MTKTFGTSYGLAWSKLGLSQRYRPEEVFPRFQKKDFEDLKNRYVQEHGYVIKIPGIDDIVHWKPREMKTLAEIKAEKRKNLMNILASPAPNWFRTYSTVMTWIDNVQDTGSIIFPAVSMLARWMPKIFNRVLPIFGWLMVGYDILNYLNAIGRMNFKGMDPKRLTCGYHKYNPFVKMSRRERVDRLRNYKPNMADLIQVMQTTDQITGVGLSLGPIVGTAWDILFGAYRYVTGDRVRILQDLPDMFEHEDVARKALKASSYISSAGQVFDDETHYWSFIFGAIGARLYAPYAFEADTFGAIDDPMNVMLPAAEPRDPITIDVIKEAGLDVEKGIGWPFNEKKEIPAGEMIDYVAQHSRETFRDFSFRHAKDWYGYTAALAMDQTIHQIITAAEPQSITHWDDEPLMRTAYTMIKAGLLPSQEVSEEKGTAFVEWVKGYTRLYGKHPGLMAVKEKLDLLGIPYQERYPTERTPEADKYWPREWPGFEYMMV